MEPIDIDWINIDTLTHISASWETECTLFTKDTVVLMEHRDKNSDAFWTQRSKQRTSAPQKATYKSKWGWWITQLPVTMIKAYNGAVTIAKSHHDNSTFPAQRKPRLCSSTCCGVFARACFGKHTLMQQTLWCVDESEAFDKPTESARWF